jgi:hypothetical protein
VNFAGLKSVGRMGLEPANLRSLGIASRTGHLRHAARGPARGGVRWQ